MYPSFKVHVTPHLHGAPSRWKTFSLQNISSKILLNEGKFAGTLFIVRSLIRELKCREIMLDRKGNKKKKRITELLFAFIDT